MVRRLWPHKMDSKLAGTMSNIKLNSKVFTTGETSKTINPVGSGEYHKNLAGIGETI